MTVLHADLIGRLPEGRSKTQRGFRYVLSVVDSATRYMWLIPLRNKTADAVAVALYDQIVTKVSVPSAILTDQGGEFTSDVIKQLCTRLGIARLRTSAYHPQTDAKCERAHFSIHNMIVKLAGSRREAWPELISAVALAYNCTVHLSTGYSPHELFYSFRPSYPLDVLVDSPSEEPASSADEFAYRSAERLREAFAYMRRHSGRQMERMKSYYDASIKPRTFQVNQFVLLYSPKRKRGVYARWHISWAGPFRVVKRLNATNYVVQRSPRSRAFVVHADRLKPYFGEVSDVIWPTSGGKKQAVGSSNAPQYGDGQPSATATEAGAHDGPVTHSSLPCIPVARRDALVCPPLTGRSAGPAVLDCPGETDSQTPQETGTVRPPIQGSQTCLPCIQQLEVNHT